MVLDYWNNIFPRVDIEQLRYGLRHLSDSVNLPGRTALFENSFVPPAIQQWNSLPCHLRQCPSLATFKRELLSSKFPSRSVPLHFCMKIAYLLLLFGSEAWIAEQNIEIVEAVHTCIKRTKRFT